MIFQNLTLPGKDKPFKIKGPLSEGTRNNDFNTLGDIISVILPYIFVIAGLILFFIIIGAGFTMFTSAGNPDKVKKAQGQLTFGLVGFIIIFASYFIAQLLGKILGLNILGN